MDKITEKIKQGKIFIYPTDTIYGLGCDATNQEAVNKIKQIKSRDKDKPLSIIAPSIDWIKENCVVDVDLDKYLPGPYTLLLKKKNPQFLPHISENNLLGIRIPSNPLTKDIQKSLLPFVTTSVNLAGEPFATQIKDISKKIIGQVDKVIDNGPLSGRPSTLIIDGKEIKR
jgi:L-threonylcarbamoyladenylate synthase